MARTRYRAIWWPKNFTASLCILGLCALVSVLALPLNGYADDIKPGLLALDSVENFAAYANGSLNVSGTTTINGDLGLGPDGTQNFITTPTVNGTYVNSGLGSVSTKISGVSAYAASLTPTATYGTINNKTTITASGGYAIANIGTISLLGNGGHYLILSGGPDDIFVLNVSNSVSFLQTTWQPVVLSGGVTPDHVLFNLLNTAAGATALFVTNDVTLVGTFIAPDASMTLGSVNLNGGVFAGGDNLNLIGSTITADVFMLPEPSSFALVGFSCLIGFGLWPRRRR
ncbi:MAG TPA: collagen-binding domain-containing protein [Verrucomicrobiae bacterium]|nr:collagen-binding domain-containing protein [Verrucomicrobiae bacterium]